jgi:hypothetical protein
MPSVKNGVAGFTLESSSSGAYHYRLRQDIGRGNQMVYEVTIHDDDRACNWSVMAGAWFEGSGRTPEQIQSIEQYGGPAHCAPSFEDARKKAYAFMRAFSGSPGYNGLLDLAAEASWRHEIHGRYGG